MMNSLVYNWRMIRFCFILSVMALLAACSSLQDDDKWSNELPPQPYFLSAYESDAPNQTYQSLEDYLFWVERFYNGINLVPGWSSLSGQVLEKLEEPQLSVVETRLYNLGLKIGAEWPKDNQVRLLNSRSANVWRDALIESLSRDELDAYLSILEQDVTDLLAGKIDNEAIYFERYYQDDFDF